MGFNPEDEVAVTVAETDPRLRCESPTSDTVVTAHAVLIADPRLEDPLTGKMISLDEKASFHYDVFTDTFVLDEATVEHDTDSSYQVGCVLSETPRISIQTGDSLEPHPENELAQKAIYAYVTTRGITVMFDPYATQTTPQVSPDQFVAGDPR